MTSQNAVQKQCTMQPPSLGAELWSTTWQLTPTHYWRLLLLNKDSLMDLSELESLILLSEAGRGWRLPSRPSPQSGELGQGLHISGLSLINWGMNVPLPATHTNSIAP